VNPLRGRAYSPEEGAAIRQFIADVVRASVDELVDRGYLLRAEGGQIEDQDKGFRGSEATVPFSLERVTMEVVARRLELQ